MSDEQQIRERMRKAIAECNERDYEKAQSELAPVAGSAPRGFRCWRCGELPRSVRMRWGHGLKCSCRGYVVSHKTWWTTSAIKDRPFPFPDQVPAEAHAHIDGPNDQVDRTPQ